MELYQLNTFVTIARLGNMTRAADALFLSLSALSTQMKQLEDELGLKLFLRKPRGVELTAEGKCILDYAVAAVNSADEVKRQAYMLKDEVFGKLVIGLNTDPLFLRIKELGKQFEEILNNSEILFETSLTIRTAHYLKNGALDMGFIYGTIEDDEIVSIPITSARINVVAPKNISEDIENATWDELLALPWVWASDDCPFYKELMYKVQDRKTPKKIIMSTDEAVMSELVRSGSGVSVLRSDYAEKLVNDGCATVWGIGEMEIPVSITFLHGRKDEPIIKAALTVIKGVFAD